MIGYVILGVIIVFLAFRVEKLKLKQIEVVTTLNAVIKNVNSMSVQINEHVTSINTNADVLRRFITSTRSELDFNSNLLKEYGVDLYRLEKTISALGGSVGQSELVWNALEDDCKELDFED